MIKISLDYLIAALFVVVGLFTVLRGTVMPPDFEENEKQRIKLRKEVLKIQFQRQKEGKRI